jgi:riboflavin kinase/FMN adenylyltransferase
MRIFRHTTGLSESARGHAVAVGNFDGLHRGHRAVIEAARAAAGAAGVPLGVVTFEPHPRRFFRPADPPFELTPLRTKVRLLRSLGIDTLYLTHFDEQFAAVTAENFVSEMLVGGLGVRHLAVGYDFVFGNRRRGNVALLRQLAPAAGIGLTVVEPVRVDGGEVYSSTRIRNALTAGAPREAAEILGRCWEIEGRVRKGDQRGRQIGFPTANIGLGESLEPKLGVYAVWAGFEDGARTSWHMGCANIGRRPTFAGEQVQLEVYVFDFADDVYDRLMRIALVEFIRPEQKFDGIASLRAQIARDCSATRSILDGLPKSDVRAPPELVWPASEKQVR